MQLQEDFQCLFHEPHCCEQRAFTPSPCLYTYENKTASSFPFSQSLASFPPKNIAQHTVNFFPSMHPIIFPPSFPPPLTLKDTYPSLCFGKSFLYPRSLDWLAREAAWESKYFRFRSKCLSSPIKQHRGEGDQRKGRKGEAVWENRGFLSVEGGGGKKAVVGLKGKKLPQTRSCRCCRIQVSEMKIGAPRATSAIGRGAGRFLIYIDSIRARIIKF